MKKGLFCFLWVVSLWGLPSVSTAQDFSAVPGTVLDYTELNYSWGHSAPDKYVADPEIMVLSSGTYLMCHSWAGVDYGDTTSTSQTRIYRSTNSGASWTYITTLTGFVRGSLFQHGSYVYMLGSTEEDVDGVCVMARSVNDGVTWTQTSFSSIAGLGPASPSNPIMWNGRWWVPKNTEVLSMPTTSDPYAVGSWTRSTGFPASASTAWATASITEHQIVASPNLGVFSMAQSRYEKISAVARMADYGSGSILVRFDNSLNGFVDLPCGEKKFGAAYDSVSGKFYVLGNPNLPSDEASWSGDNIDMIRNTAAVLSSKDLKHWNMEQIFIYSSDWNREGYGYLNFDFDGDDIVVAARTASCDIPGETDPNSGRGGHDSNCFTYHRIEDFRTTVADHVVQATGSNVILFERTAETVDQHVPFGNFALGNYASTVADATEVGVSASWDIYVKRPSGTIYRFDPFGNFLETVASAPVTGWYSAVLSRPSAGESCWTKSSSGDWKDQVNWHYWGRADTSDEVAVFGTAITGNSTINLSSMQQTWNFDTTGDFEGWTVNRASATVGSGTLSGTATSTSAPYLIRDDCFFYGSDVPTVAIRMQASENCDVYLFWGESVDPASMTYTHVQYTGNGAWQTVQLNMEGVSTWEGKAIARLRIDPRVSMSETFNIDWISLPQASARIKGMRFNNSAASYTIDGNGLVVIDSESGNGSIEVVKGSHVIDAAIHLKDTTDVTLASGTVLSLTGNVNLYGRTLNVSGAGQFKIGGGIVYLSGGEIVTDGQTPIYINSGISGALNGTLEFDPGAGFSPASGQNYDLLDNASALGSMTFTTVTLPSLPTGLYWNTSALYTSGVVSIAAVQRTLTVSSAYGSPSPSVGAHSYDYGTSMSASVSTPVVSGTTRYLCTGWTGTGNVPSSGSSANTGSFTLTVNSTVNWNWSTQYWLDTAATAGGSVNVGDGWYNSGANVAITASPGTGYHFSHWSGDTYGDVYSTVMTLPMTAARAVTANFAPDQRTLSVSSAHGSPSPSVGVNTYDYGTSMSASVSSPVVNGTTRYVCDGWDGTGSVPSSGGGLNTGSFTLTQNSTINWLWYTQYWLDTAATVGGSVNVGDSWQVSGANVTITATAGAGANFIGWTGNTYGDTGNPVMTLPMTMARAVTANFELYINFVETFESYTAGSGINGQNGWTTSAGSAVVTNLTYTWDDVYHPVESAAHTKVLVCDEADISVDLITNAAPMNTTVDLMINPLSGAQPEAALLAGRQSAFYVDQSGQLNVWCGLDATGTNNAWIAYTSTSISSSEWVRVTFEFDYTTDSGGGNFFRVRLNGEELSPGSNCYVRGASSFTANAAGTWLRTANPAREQLFNFSFEGSGMLDDVVITDDEITDFFTDRSLTVYSTHGSPSPSVGAHTYAYGTSLSASVNTPVVNGTTRYVCSGWTGTGNVPASGSSANTGSFTLTGDSTVTWQWATQYWLDTAATAGGSVNLGDSWLDDGSNVTIIASSATGYHFIGWSGDTSGDTNNTVMTLPMTMARAVTANFEIDEHTLTVSSVYGSPTPAVGVHTYDYGTSMSASVNTPIVNGTTRYVCSGWTGSGSVPASGGSANTGNFTLTQDSAVAWQWTTQYWLDTAATAGGSVDVADSWQNSGANVVVTATAAAGYHFIDWSGDTSGDVNNAVMTLPMTEARAVTASFRPYVNFVETFESYTAGSSVVGSNGWTATSNSTAIVTNLTYTWNDVYHPVESAAHTKVLTCDQTDLSVSFATNVAAVNTTVDLMVCPVPGTQPQSSSLSGRQSAFYVDLSGQLNVWCGLDATGTNNVWLAYTNTSISTSEWIRVTYEFDYTTDSGGDNFFRVRLNGVELSPGSNCYTRGSSSFTANSSGTWLRTANPACEQIFSFGFEGVGMLDDLVVTDEIITSYFPPQSAAAVPLGQDSDGDGMPDWQELIAGTNPNDSDSTFEITGVIPVVESGQEGVVVRWTSELDRFYDLYWSTNLAEGFIPLATDLPAVPPENAYTNPYSGPVFFYKVEAREE